MITEMVKAHLENVKSLLNDLENQKTNIQNEIDKLTSYLSKGLEELKVFENSLSTEKFSNKKQYLGE